MAEPASSATASKLVALPSSSSLLPTTTTASVSIETPSLAERYVQVVYQYGLLDQLVAATKQKIADQSHVSEDVIGKLLQKDIEQAYRDEQSSVAKAAEKVFSKEELAALIEMMSNPVLAKAMVKMARFREILGQVDQVVVTKMRETVMERAVAFGLKTPPKSDEQWTMVPSSLSNLQLYQPLSQHELNERKHSRGTDDDEESSFAGTQPTLTADQLTAIQEAAGGNQELMDEMIEEFMVQQFAKGDSGSKGKK